MKKLFCLVLIASLSSIGAQADSVTPNPDGTKTIIDNYGNSGVVDQQGHILAGTDRYGAAGIVGQQGSVSGIDRYGNPVKLSPAMTNSLLQQKKAKLHNSYTKLKSTATAPVNGTTTTTMTPGRIVTHNADGSTTITDGNSGTITKIPAGQ